MYGNCIDASMKVWRGIIDTQHQTMRIGRQGMSPGILDQRLLLDSHLAIPDSKQLPIDKDAGGSSGNHPQPDMLSIGRQRNGAYKISFMPGASTDPGRCWRSLIQLRVRL